MCDIFDERYSAIKHTIAYDANWESQGYYNRLVFNEDIKRLTDPLKSSDDQGRRIIIVPTFLGNVVVFERWPQDSCLTSSVPPKVSYLANPIEVVGILDRKAVEFLIGSHKTPHLGERLRFIARQEPA